MNTTWAEEWAANFADLDKLMLMYADDAQFEDVIIAHKERGKAALAKFFAAAGNPVYAENTIVAVSYCGNTDAGAVEWIWQAKHVAGKILGIPGDRLWRDGMNQPLINQLPDTLLPTGERAECTNAYGVYDMVGNVHEWADDGAFHGGYYLDTKLNGEGCEYITTAHAKSYYDYSTGFRCCADVDDL